MAVFFCFLPQLVASDAIGCPPFKKIDHIGAVRKNTRQQKWKAKDFCTMASKLSFQTDINSIHPLCSSFEVECNDITLSDIRNNIVHVKEIFWLSGNIWLVSFKISYLCLPLFYETRTTPSCHPSGCAYRQL